MKRETARAWYRRALGKPWLAYGVIPVIRRLNLARSKTHSGGRMAAVVEDLDEEVFFVDGWYWARRGDFWYRARDHRRAWVFVEPRFVPPGLRRIPPGLYRRFRKAEWKAMKEEEKARRKAIKEEEKARRHEEKEAAKGWKKGHKHKHDDRDDD